MNLPQRERRRRAKVKSKKVPMRLCLGCQTLKPKQELVRILRDPDGNIVLDTTGKKTGRGAYICKNEACFLAAKKGHRVERSFGCRISNDTYEEMYHELQQYLGLQGQK